MRLGAARKYTGVALCGCGRRWPRGPPVGVGWGGGIAPQQRRAWNTDSLLLPGQMSFCGIFPTQAPTRRPLALQPRRASPCRSARTRTAFLFIHVLVPFTYGTGYYEYDAACARRVYDSPMNRLLDLDRVLPCSRREERTSS